MSLEEVLASAPRKKKLYTNERVLAAAEKEKEKKERMERDENERLAALFQMEQQEADDELRETVDRHTAIYHLPTQEELENDINRVVPPSEIRSHIESILEVLADFKSRREQGRARSEYSHAA